MFPFFCDNSAVTEIYTLSLHDALPISGDCPAPSHRCHCVIHSCYARSEEHTTELQSRLHLVCRPLPEKKKRLAYPQTEPTTRLTFIIGTSTHPNQQHVSDIMHHMHPQP